MRMVPLGDIADFINGAAFKPEDWAEEGVRIIRIQNLNDPSKPFNLTTRQVAEKYLVPQGSLLVSWSASLGVFEWSEPDTALLNQHIFKVVPDTKLVHQDYLRLMLSKALKDMEKYAHGSTMLHVNRGEFLATKIPLPPLNEQKRIATILDQADSLRRARRRAIEKLNTLAQSIFYEMFGDLSNPNDLRKKFKTCPLSKVVDFKGGGTPSKSNKDYYTGDIPWVTPKDMKVWEVTTSQDKITQDAIQNSATNLIQENSVLIVNRSGILKHTLPVAITRKPVAINQDMKALIAKSQLKPDFLAHLIKSAEPIVLKWVRATTADNFPIDNLKDLEIPIPDIKIQEKFVTIVQLISKQIRTLETNLDMLESLFSSLQHRAFRGEL